MSVERDALNKLEGFGKGYREALLQFALKGIQYTPYVYVADAAYLDPALRPYDWYKEMVLLGAKYHKFPSNYVTDLELIPSIPDPDGVRLADRRSLLAEMAQF